MLRHHVFDKPEYLSAHLYVLMHLESLDRTKCYPTPCLIHGKFTKAMESPKLSYNANFKWKFHSECLFLSSLSVRKWKKLRKFSLSSKTSKGEDTWTATIGHRELIICAIDSFTCSFLSHLSRRLIGELIVYRSSRRPCVRPSVRTSVHTFKHEYLCNQ